MENNGFRVSGLAGTDLSNQPLQPEEGFWADMGGSSRALLMYDDLRKMDSSKTALLDFLGSAYRAAARTAGWGRSFHHDQARLSERQC